MVPAEGAALIRIAIYPSGLVVPAWPDPAADGLDAWRNWLKTAWLLPGFAEAVTAAAPELAAQITHAVTGDPQPQLRRLGEAAVRYLLRWTTRATPFGLFAGVAPVAFGPKATVCVGEDHHAVARVDGQTVDDHITRIEQDMAALRTVAVVTNSLGYRRGTKWVLPCARAEDEHRWDVEIGLSDAVRTAITTASSPIAFADLATTLAGNGDSRAAEGLLAELVRLGALVSALRPAMTVSDPTPHLVANGLVRPPAGRCTVDSRADVAVTLPPAVLQEAGRAASALTAIAPPFPGWVDYRDAFGERWGPGAAVPLRDVLDVLGFPAGYRGSSRRIPAVLTARDRLLGQLAQQSALDGYAEVELDDDLIEKLRSPDARPPVPHTELRFALAADTARDLDRGRFVLTVLSGSRHAGVSAGRFLHLLTSDERAAFQRTYQHLPTVTEGADHVQLSGPPLDARFAAVARVPELLPVLPVGEFHPAPPVSVGELAVAGDDQRLWLLSRTTGRPVEPLLFNSVLLPTLQQPLMRFLTEISTAWNAPCSRLDWGYAADLPFLPRVRRGRSILHPARWVIQRASLPPRAAKWQRWREEWQWHRRRLRLPRDVLVGHDDVRLHLNLDDDTQLGVLRGQLDRHPSTEITEAPGSAGWIDGRPAELVLTLTGPASATRPARPARPASGMRHWPGGPRWLEARLFGHLDALLADLAARPDDHLPAGWWFLRYRDPAPYLRLRLPLPRTGRTGAADFTQLADHLARWTEELTMQAILSDYSLHTYRPETRHGTGTTGAAAEAVFAADSRAVLHRLTGDRQAATAAGMIAIADAFTGDGLRWLTDHIPHRTGPRLDPEQRHLAGVPFRDERLRTALATYRRAAERAGLDLDQILADLLHLHHARMIGPDTASEQHCARLARTVARAAGTRAAS